MAISCKDETKVEQEIAGLAIDFRLDRFDSEFAEATPEDLPVLRKKYPYLFPAPDSVWVAKMKDSVQMELRDEVKTAFDDLDALQTELQLLFKHIHYYFPNKKLPKVITATNDVDFDNRIIWADSLLFISLDNYLGPDHHFYQQAPKYVRKNMDARFLTVDVAQAFAQQVVPPPTERTFLAQMVYFGKVLYVVDALLPDLSDAQKMHYSEEEMTWVNTNEEPMWRYFVERSLLYSTDIKLGAKFLDPAPFSKFGLELDNDSPGQVGRYLGWRIVKDFMDHNAVTLQQMLPLPAEELFTKANYKPKR